MLKSIWSTKKPIHSKKLVPLRSENNPKIQKLNYKHILSSYFENSKVEPKIMESYVPQKKAPKSNFNWHNLEKEILEFIRPLTSAVIPGIFLLTLQ